MSAPADFGPGKRAKAAAASSTPAATGAAEAAAAAVVAPRLDSLPDVIHELIQPFLGREHVYRILRVGHISDQREVVAVAQTCKALLAPYGRRFQSLCIWNRRGAELPALTGFLLRQESLLEMYVEDWPLIPSVASALAAGAGRRLKLLLVGEREDMEEAPLLNDHCVQPLLPLFQGSPGLLPELKQLCIVGKCPCEVGGFEAFMGLLAQGAAPRLRRLELNLEGSGDVCDRRFECVVSALEARRALGCAGLGELFLEGHSWVMDGPLAVRRRLWAVLLPTVENIPCVSYRDPDRPVDEETECILADAIVLHGAPCVWRMEIWEPPALRCLPHLSGLEELALDRMCADGAAVLEEVFAAAAAAAGPRSQPLLSGLKKLHIVCRDWEGEEAFIVALGRVAAATNPELSVRFPSDEAGRDLGRALAAGAFPALARLGTQCVRPTALGYLLLALMDARCAQSLQSLAFSGANFADSLWSQALGMMISTGRLPALTEIRFNDGRLGETGMKMFFSMFRVVAHPRLEVLEVSDAYVGDPGVKALAGALGAGQLGSRLRQLVLIQDSAFDDPSPPMTDAAGSALRDAIVQGRAHMGQLEELTLRAPGMTVEGMVAFVEGVVPACPSLRSVGLRWLSRGMEGADKLVRAAASRVAGGRKIDFHFGYC